MGNVIPQSQVANENAAARNAALSGCSITVTGSSYHGEYVCWAAIGCGTQWVRSNATYTTTVNSSGVATTTMTACWAQRSAWDPSIPMASGLACSAWSYNAWDPSQILTTSVSGGVTDQLVSGNTYRFVLRAMGQDGSVTTATCPNMYTLPGYEPAYMTP